MSAKLRTARVLSNKMQKTVVVVIDRLEHDPVYKKSVRRITKLYAHDPKGEAKPGDVVEIQEVRPLSKSKRWLVKGVVKKSAKAKVEEALGPAEATSKAGA